MIKEQLKDLMPDDKIEELISIGKERTIKNMQLFVRAGDVPTKIAFVITGLFRYVYVKENGEEFTKGLMPENNFLSSYSSMILNKPSHFNIEALEPSVILEINWLDFKSLLEMDVFWVKFLLRFVEKGYMIKEKRERDLLLLDAETRYKNFLVEYPRMDQRIKQGVIASYLGIQPETLSRIRRKIVF